MKRIIFTSLNILIFTSVLLSCSSEIDENERLVYVEPAAATRSVLIEDFTGQRCVNCPKATETIEQLMAAYNSDTAEYIIPVAIHSGPMGVFKDGNNFVALGTDTGKDYWNAWFSSTQGQPVGKINRGDASTDLTSWAGTIAAALANPTDVSISAIAAISADSITATITTLGKAGVKANLQVWLTEDSIQTLQLMPNGSANYDYIHNHVFRAAFNGTWGEPITFAESEIYTDYTIALDPRWNPSQLHVVAFVYDDTGVLNVTRSR